MEIQDGPMDIVRGDTVDYILYGKEVGQHYMPSRGAWDNVYHFSHADYYLIKVNKETEETKIVGKWLAKPNAYGQLLFDQKTKTLTVRLCGIGYKEMIVTDVLNRDQSRDKTHTLICTSKKQHTSVAHTPLITCFFTLKNKDSLH